MNQIEIASMGANITLVYDGAARRKYPNRGNFLGLHFIPPQGNREWHAVNGDWGDAKDDAECVREIEAAWQR